MKRSTLALLAVLLLCINAYANKDKSKPKIKFGDVTAEDFSPKFYAVDSSANAVVIADIGESTFEGNTKGDFSLIFTEHKRIRLMNKNAFDLATIEVLLYIGRFNNEEKLDDLEAVTYNLEDGKVTAVKLDKASVFKDKYDEHHVVRKFTFPNLKEGSIIEYRYKITSPYYENLQPWSFQSKIPHLWSEYTVKIPQFFDYALDKQNYLKFDIDTVSSADQFFYIVVPGDGAMESSRSYNIRSTTISAKWGMKDVPAIKEESYITSLDNYIQKVSFQLRRIKWSESSVQEIMSDWYKTAERMMKYESFGEPLTHNNNFMDDVLEKEEAGTKDTLERAHKIYEYFRDNFTCKTSGGMFMANTLKKTFQDKSGNVADINLLLVAAFKTRGFEAYPAILSTRANGKAPEFFPILDKFNYVVCCVKIDNKPYLLDATNSKLGFGKLPAKCYNGTARVIDPAFPTLVDLSADSLIERKITTVFITPNDKKELLGAYASKLGSFESLHLREKGGIGKGEDYLKELKKQYTFDIELSNAEVDSLKRLDDPAAIKYDMKFNFNDDDIIYFNPMLGDAEKENPFKSAQRLFPIEMPFQVDDNYILNMEVPENYKIEELPKSTRVKLNETDGMFQYLIGATNNHIQLQCRLQINKTLFEPEDYQTLRDFFTYVVSKEAEQIVLKKIK